MGNWTKTAKISEQSPGRAALRVMGWMGRCWVTLTLEANLDIVVKKVKKGHPGAVRHTGGHPGKGALLDGLLTREGLEFADVSGSYACRVIDAHTVRLLRSTRETGPLNLRYKRRTATFTRSLDEAVSEVAKREGMPWTEIARIALRRYVEEEHPDLAP